MDAIVYIWPSVLIIIVGLIIMGYLWLRLRKIRNKIPNKIIENLEKVERRFEEEQQNGKQIDGHKLLYELRTEFEEIPNAAGRREQAAAPGASEIEPWQPANIPVSADSADDRAESEHTGIERNPEKRSKRHRKFTPI